MSDLNDPRVFFAAERTLLAWNGNLLVQHIGAKPRTIEHDVGGGILAAITISPDSRLAAVAVNSNDGRGAVHRRSLAGDAWQRATTP